MSNKTVHISELSKSVQSATVQPTATPSSEVMLKTSIKSTTKVPVDRATRALNRLNDYLNIYLSSANGSNQKLKALTDLTDIVYNNPKKNILDTVYRWFVANRNSDALNPRNALQGLQTVSPSANMRVRILYQVMSKLSCGDKNIRLNIDTIQSILGEDVAAWVSVKLEANRHRR